MVIILCEMKTISQHISSILIKNAEYEICA